MELFDKHEIETGNKELLGQKNCTCTEDGTMGQIFCSRGRPLENSRGRPVDFTGRPINSTGHPLEFSRGCPVKFFIAFLDEIGNYKSFEANMQNCSGRPAEFYWTSSRI